MRDTMADLKLLAAGIGIGALICAAIVGHPAAHTCGMVATISVLLAMGFRVAEART